MQVPKPIEGGRSIAGLIAISFCLAWMLSAFGSAPASAGMLLPHLQLSWEKSKYFGKAHLESISTVKVESWLHSHLAADTSKLTVEGDFTPLVVAAPGTADSVLGLRLHGDGWNAVGIVEMTVSAKPSGCKPARRGELLYRNEATRKTVVLPIATGYGCWQAEAPITNSYPEAWSSDSVVWLDFSEAHEASTSAKTDVVARLGGLLQP